LEPEPDSQGGWRALTSDAPDLFAQLRAAGAAEIHLRFGVGTDEGYRVAVPAASLTLRGALRVEATTDRLSIQVPGWGAGDFVWFSRRKGRGRTDYWQAAIEYRPAGLPALVLYLTAPLDGLEIRIRPDCSASR
jgi:hypothetical protein